jgi:hypothetical protein
LSLAQALVNFNISYYVEESGVSRLS